MKTDHSNTKEIQGIVVPCKWNKKGVITGIAIAAYDETVIPVFMDTTGKRMIYLIHEKVTASGRMVTIDDMHFMNIDRFKKDL